MDAAPIPVETLLEHREWVRAVARAVVRDPNAADDVEQDAWVAALSSPPRHESSLRGWFDAVVRSRARRTGRTDARRGRRETAAARADADASAADLAEIADTHRRVVQAVVELAEPYRQTILLRYFEGLAVEDVAARTAVPINTARARIARGLAQLRERLARELGEDDRPLEAALAPLIGGRRGSAAGAAAAVGGMTKTVWIAAAAVLVVGLGAVAAARWLPSASSADVAVVAAAPAPPRPVVAADDAPAKPAAPPVAQSPAPPPKPREHASEPPPSAAPTITERLTSVRVTLHWKEIPVLDATGELAAKTGVEIVVAAEVADRLEKDATIASLSLEDVSGKTAIAVMTTLGGLAYVVEETRVVIVLSGQPRDHTRPVVVPPAPDTSPNAPKSLTVKGVVVDEKGAPVAHAPVVAWGATDVTRLAESDETGSFVFEATRPFPRVFADVPGRIPSAAGDLSGKYGDTVELRLVLGSGAAVIEGHVVDADGRDVDGATVSFGHRDAAFVAAMREESPGVLRRQWPASKPVKTDATGRFRAEDVAPGRIEVGAFTPSTTAIKDGATVTTRGSEAIAITQAKPSETVHVELRFGEGTLRCVGTLRDAAGAAVAGATMEGGGSRTVTPADGTFALTFTRSGIKRIRIAAPDGRKSDRFVDVADGVDLRWDPVLRPMWRIAGRVVDGAGGWENGSALFEVALVPVPPWAWPATPQGWRSTSRDGSFAFENVQPSRYRLVAMAGSMMGSLPVATSAEFDSEQKDFVFRLPATIKPKARVTAKLVDAQSRPIEKAVLCIEPVDNTTTAWAESNAAGIVARGPLAPWRYRFYAKDCPGGLVTDLGERDVVTSDVDLGTVTFAAPGRARMTWTADGDVAPGTAHGTIVSVLADGWRVGVAGAFDFSGPSPASWLLAPGRYVVRATGGTIEGVERTFEVRSGEETAVDVPLRAAPQRRVALRFPLGPPSIGRVRITDAAGGFVHESQLLATDLLVPLAPGRFRVAVDVTETITVSGTLDVPAENAPERLEVVLR